MPATETLKTVIDVSKAVKEMVIEECAQAAEAAADEWWKSLKGKDAGDQNAVDFGSLPDHIIRRIRELKHEPAATPSKPVILCSCGKVLENPAMYAAHCAESPTHFTQS